MSLFYSWLFAGQKSCSPGFTNYWRHGCYWVDPTARGRNNVNWSDSEARCQEFGPNVHLAGKKYLNIHFD